MVQDLLQPRPSGDSDLGDRRLRNLVEEFLSHSPAAHSSDLLDADVHSLNESCDLADSTLLALSQKEQDVAVEGDEMLKCSACLPCIRGATGSCGPHYREIRSPLEV